MVTDDVGTVVEFVGDVRRGVDDLKTVIGAFCQLVDDESLEVLGALFLDSLVLHVVGEDEAGIAHHGQVERGEENGEAGDYLQIERGGGGIAAVAVVGIGDVACKIDIEAGGAVEVGLPVKVVVEEVGAVVADAFVHLRLPLALLALAGFDEVLRFFQLCFQAAALLDELLVVLGVFEHGLVLEYLSLEKSLLVDEAVHLFVGRAAHALEHGVEGMTLGIIIFTEGLDFGIGLHAQVLVFLQDLLRLLQLEGEFEVDAVGMGKSCLAVDGRFAQAAVAGLGLEGQRRETLGTELKGERTQCLAGLDGVLDGGFLPIQFLDEAGGVGDGEVEAFEFLLGFEPLLAQACHLLLLILYLGEGGLLRLLGVALAAHLVNLAAEVFYLAVLMVDDGVQMGRREVLGFLQGPLDGSDVGLGGGEFSGEFLLRKFGLIEVGVENAHQEVGDGLASGLVVELLVEEEGGGGRLLVDVDEAQELVEGDVVVAFHYGITHQGE